jgi:hypothetical protein
VYPSSPGDRCHNIKLKPNAQRAEEKHSGANHYTADPPSLHTLSFSLSRLPSSVCVCVFVCMGVCTHTEQRRLPCGVCICPRDPQMGSVNMRHVDAPEKGPYRGSPHPRLIPSGTMEANCPDSRASIVLGSVDCYNGEPLVSRTLHFERLIPI